MRRPLDGVEILEYGDRIAVGACGSVLLGLGARVSTVALRLGDRWPLPAAQTADKQCLTSADAIRDALERADIVITSSDLTPLQTRTRAPSQIVCDVTAYGTSGPMAGIPHSDALVQAMSGLADTTGEPDGPPTLCPFPQTEGIAALSFYTHFENITKGVLDLRDMLYFALVIVFFLVASAVALDSRKSR